jgi:hypothetical protein
LSDGFFSLQNIENFLTPDCEAVPPTLGRMPEQYEREISNRFEASAELGQIRDLLSQFSFAAEGV